MKKFFTLSMVILITLNVFAQSPQKMSYQAVIRDAGNKLVTGHAVGMRISILSGSPTGTPVYIETQAPTTNANGLVTIEIGSVSPVTGTFAGIDWSAGPYYIKTETDPTGGTNYTITGTSQLLSVPYALYAKTSETPSNAVTITGNQTITGIKTFSTDLLVNELTIGKGNGPQTTNTALGYHALNSNTTGWGNTAIGYTALTPNTTGYGNTANGYAALSSNTTGYNNTANGVQALYLNTTGQSNTAYGYYSLYSNTTGSNNTANGVEALYFNTTGYFNTANGYDALYSNSTGVGNTANGFFALRSNTTGNNNTVNGAEALYSNTTGNNNTANGEQALYLNTTGISNTANGYEALYSNTTGSNNAANGDEALYSNTTGSYNTANGYEALYLNTIGFSNTANGYEALYSNTTGQSNTANGVQALYSNTTGNYNTANGSEAGFSNSTGNNNVFLGYNAGYWETGSNKLFIDNQQRANEADARNKALIYGLFDADPANQVLTVNGTLKMQNLNITNLANPVNGQDAATKAYVDAAAGSVTTHSIGEVYGGGVVFYVYDNGQHGLIAATTDQSISMRWYAGTYIYTIALADGVGAGKANTAIIIANQGLGDAATYAARICNEYQVTVGGVTYGDWYLPSKFELNLLYLEKTVIGGFAIDMYWSSNFSNQEFAWGQSFDSGYQDSSFDRAYPAHVRAIRAF